MDWYIVFLLFVILLDIYTSRRELKREIGKIQDTLSSIKADIQK